MKQLLILGVLAACGPASDGRVDAGAGPGSAPSNGAQDLTCQSYTTIQTNDDGSRSAMTQKYALVDVDPTSDYLVEACDFVETINGAPSPACSTGATCTTAGTPPPTPAHVCTWFHGGTFNDDKLLVSCGFKSVSTGSNGAVTSTIETSYSAVRIRR